MSLESAVDATVTADAVEFEYTVENVGEDPAELTFRSGLTADFAVMEGEAEVWRASDGQLFTQALRPETIEAGASRTYTGAWENPTPGEYTVVAELNAAESDARAQSDFSV